MLEINNISFGYTKSCILFENVDLQFIGSSIYSFYGFSGSGKSTFLKLLSGLLLPTSGNIFYNKHDINNCGNKFLYNFRNSVIGFGYQDINLLDDFTVNDNIYLPFYFSRSNNKIDLDWKEYLLDKLELSKYINTKISKLSGGEKERVSILKAMVSKPKILILDEPGTFLNNDLKLKIYNLIKEYSKENICIVSTHDNKFREYLVLDKYINIGNLELYYN